MYLKICKNKVQGNNVSIKTLLWPKLLIFVLWCPPLSTFLLGQHVEGCSVCLFWPWPASNAVKKYINMQLQDILKTNMTETGCLVFLSGYGHIYPVTDEGKIFCILYSLVGCPLLLIFLGGLGNTIADTFIYIYRWVWVPVISSVLFSWVNSYHKAFLFSYFSVASDYVVFLILVIMVVGILFPFLSELNIWHKTFSFSTLQLLQIT